MATVSVTVIGATTDEIRTATWALAKINEERAAQELAPFANIQAFLSDHILNTILPSWQAGEAAETLEAQLKAAYKVATDAQRAAALVALTTIP